MSAHTPTDEREIHNFGQLERYMLARTRQPGEELIGTEYEKIGWYKSDFSAPAYEGERGIRALLEAFAREGWTPLYEGESIIALSRAGATITLEPGGQLELSGAPLPNLAAMSAELDAYLHALREHSAPFELAWSGIGLNPRPADALPQMPKARYQIMRRYLPTRGAAALTMMHCTGTVQANFDFHNEADAMRKLRASLWIQPIVSAIFASSPVRNLREVGASGHRCEIWLDTDPDRCRYPLALLEADQPLRTYIDWALSVPLFFIAREGIYLDCAGVPFRRFLEEGWRGHRATVGDFALHLSTLFPPARLKQQLEVRGADMGPIAYAKALPALHAGLLYDPKSLEMLLDRFNAEDPSQLPALERLIPSEGLNAHFAGAPISEWARWLLKLARDGLSRREPSAARLLDPLDVALDQDAIPAEALRAAWHQGGLPGLLRASRIA
ncbi:MAG: glutamate-cysteine ligase family protein [Myxococcota bacterium]|nr:glutamate-cysteine ligase family protein [Myxococcota bacterium]